MRAAAALLAIPLLLTIFLPARAAELPWWNDAVFYEVFVRSFRDSDGDGVGDLRGLIEKLDYLNDGDPDTSDDLGVTGIWLMPIAESPSYHGYDVVDYYRVDGEYGTEEDFRLLMDEAGRRGIRVIVDLVMNHTSSRHPWFLASREDRNGPYRDFYVWRGEEPGWKGPWGAPAWHRAGSDWYYGVFWGGMPDLNFRNRATTDAMYRVIRFWLEDLGADGFRLDAIKHLVEEGESQENTRSTHDWLRGFCRYTRSVRPEALTVGEIWSGTSEVVQYIGNEVDLAFEFQTAGAILSSVRTEESDAVRGALRKATSLYPPSQYATFLTNHDQDRVVDVLGGNRDHARTAASLLLTGPGVPFVYYGEEIGQSGTGRHESIRTPMQWNDGPLAGFTTAGRAWRAPQSDFREVNVAAQHDDAASLLGHYRRLIRLRRDHAALRHGTWDEVAASDPGIYACLRSAGDETVLVLVNLTSREIGEYRLELSHGPLRRGEARELLTGRAVPAPDVTDAGGFTAYNPQPLAAYDTAVIRLGRQMPQGRD